MIGTFSEYQILSGPVAACPACKSYMQQTYKRRTFHICGIPLLPAGRKYRLRCMTCGYRERTYGAFGRNAISYPAVASGGLYDSHHQPYSHTTVFMRPHSRYGYRSRRPYW